MLFTPRDMFRADNTTDSIEGSVDMVVDELQNQITHVKGKTETLQKKGARDLKKKMVGEE
jgi:ribosome-associated translation inhibitor RaiA